MKLKTISARYDGVFHVFDFQAHATSVGQTCRLRIWDHKGTEYEPGSLPVDALPELAKAITRLAGLV